MERRVPPAEIMSTLRHRSGQPPVRATELDAIAVMERVRRVQPHYEQMDIALTMVAASAHLAPTCGSLLRLAHHLIQQRELPPLDRLARRQRAGLVCWFCENCPDLLAAPYLFRWVPSCVQPRRSVQARHPANLAIAGKPKAKPMMEVNMAPGPESTGTQPAENLLGYSVDELLRDFGLEAGE
jgi:hypothetical protein